MRLNARNDINNIGGIIRGGSSLQAVAGRDINATTTLADAQSVSGENRFSRTTIDSVSGIYVRGDDGRLTLHSGRDITLSGAQVVASGERGEVQLVAGRDTTLTGAQVSGDKVVMDVGRNLTLTSEQDSDRYDSTQQNASAGAASPSVRCPAPPASTSARTRCTAITIRWRSRPASLPAKAAMTSPSASIPGWMAR